MIDKIPALESAAEKIPSEAEVFALFDEIIGGDYELFRHHEDEEGLYILEVRTTDEAGDIVQYNYIRAGSYPEGNPTETVIDVVFYMGDMPVGGHPVKKFREGVWREEEEGLLTEPHEDDIECSEGMRIVKARKYDLPEDATFDDILEAEETAHLKKVAVLLELPEDTDASILRTAANERGLDWADVSLWAQYGVGLNPEKQEFELAVLNSALKEKELLQEASELNKS